MSGYNSSSLGDAADAARNVARASIFMEGDSVGVRRKAVQSHQAVLSTGGGLQRSTGGALHDDESLVAHRHHFSHVSQWLQQARKHEVASHRSEKFSTPREKWARATTRAATPPSRQDGTSPLRTRQPIRYFIRRAHDVLREVETRSTGNLLRAASPVMGRPLQTIRPNGLPGPGSYTLPSQF